MEFLTKVKKYIVSLALIGTVYPVLLQAESPDIQTLQLKTQKLANQVAYLISQNNQNDRQALIRQIDQLRGQIEVNQYQLSQLNHTVALALKNFSARLDALEKKVDRPSPSALRLARDNAAFTKAKKTLLAKNYHTAERLFNDYIRDYYNGEHYSESLYLLGQIYLIKGQNSAAYQKFKTIVTRYPKSIKIADATYALALLEIAKGNIKQGRTYLERVIKKYQKTAIASKAENALKKL